MLVPASLPAARLLFLPAPVRGEIPAEWQGIPDLPVELAEMQSWIAKKEWYAEGISRSERMRLLAGRDMASRKPTLAGFRSLCNGADADYVIFSEWEFAGKLTVASEIMNCKTGTSRTGESLFNGKPDEAIRRFVAVNFPFLRKRATTGTTVQNVTRNLFYVIDYSVSLAPEIRRFRNLVRRWARSGNAVLLLKKNTYQFFPAKTPPEEIGAYLDAAPPRGDLSLGDVGNGLIKISSLMKGAPRTVVVLTDARPAPGDEVRFPLLMRSLRNEADRVYLVTGSWFDHQVMNLYRKSARAGGEELVQLVHTMKAGSASGYKYIYLHNMNLYHSPSLLDRPDEADLKKISKIPPGSIWSGDGASLRPETMGAVYTRASGERLLENEMPVSDLEWKLERLAYGGEMVRENTGKVLLKVEGKAVWIPLKLSPEETGRDIVVQAEWVADSVSSWGFAANPSSVSVVEGDYPLLLLQTPAGIARQVKSKATVNALIRGTVVDVR